MKTTDFKPQHFENGRNFSKADFDAYICASANVTKGVYTRYLPCVAGGLVVSQIFAQGIGGAAGNLLAVVCIFGGLIAGGLSGRRSAEELKSCAARLGIDKQAVAAARRHVKNGTVAWSD